MGLDARKDNKKLGAILKQSCLMQAVPVRSCIIVDVQKLAELTANLQMLQGRTQVHYFM